MPNVKEAALRCEQFGAQGITVHPRPDERHIRYSDVLEIRPLITTEFNIEGNPIQSFTDLVCKVIPDQVTLVPDAPDAITSNAGWDTVKNRSFLTEICKEFKSKGIRTSIFVDPTPAAVEGAALCGCDRVELYTAAYAEEFYSGADAAVKDYVLAAQTAKACGLGLNAGHDLNLDNLAFFIEKIPWTDEVSIGHAIICDALYMGMEATVKAYLAAIQKGQEQYCRNI